MVTGQKLWLFMVPGGGFMVRGRFFMVTGRVFKVLCQILCFSWFQVGFSRLEVRFNGFSWFQVGFSWF